MMSESFPLKQTLGDEWRANMKKIGAVLIVSGFAIWFGGEFLIPGYNIVGLPILIVGAILYFVAKWGGRSDA
jgi:hypothetical protein